MKSPLTYERLAQGELEQELTKNDVEILDRMAAEDSAFLKQFPVSVLETSLTARRKRFALRTGWGGGALAAAILILCLPLLATPTADVSRIKSANLSLLVYHKTATGTELLGPRATLGQNDEVQLAYFAAKKQYGTILSVDGRGTITTHLPLNSSQAMEVETKQPELLPYSYKLDDAPDFEAVFFITSDRPFDVSVLRPFVKAFSVQKLSSLALPEEFSSIGFYITKKESSR